MCATRSAQAGGIQLTAKGTAMNAHVKPRFRHSAQFPWFVLATVIVVLAAAGATAVWFMRIEPMIERFLAGV
jgi:hypothetical protein